LEPLLSNVVITMQWLWSLVWPGVF